MKRQPRTSLGRLLDDLGTTLLHLVHGGPDPGKHLGGLAIHDSVDPPVLPPRALVLGIGVHRTDDIVALLDDLGSQGAAGLVLRAPVPVDGGIRAAAERSGVAVLGLTPGASWAQLAAMLRSLLAEDDVADPEPATLGGVPSGDLFTLANAIAALLDAPVTIEDRSSRVLAFSGRQDEADRARVEAILGRQVPEPYSRELAERGVFQQIYRGDDPVFISPSTGAAEAAGFSVPRVATAVRAGDEILGSIWAAVKEPLEAERAHALRDAAKLVALHMLRVRAGADVERRLRAELVGTALEGGPGARDALNRLGLADQPVVVLALALSDSADEPSIGADAVLTAERQRVADAFAMHVSAVHPRSTAALVGDVAYALVPAGRDVEDGEERALRIASDFVDRIGDHLPAVIGVGAVADAVADLAHARSCADRALRVLRSQPGNPRVARLPDVHVQSLMLELRDMAAARGDRPSGTVARLLAYDERHHASLVQTLSAWLDAFGDVIAASASIHVHPNTFRYRLRRVGEVGGIDLADPEARFAAMLQLRLHSLS
ncbi:DNA-binding PucR family transcriptional regulator [Streptomyces sp. Ag109_O5-1]|uniref:PucR family transcriptional regulator n=1 Tax=Streptomyces sp. Ag109_O5-1 TaxID=1938851 RepID=UPI000F4F23A6|nr:PucR family transcriptional regulator [Streptomyces sp. Ag109_O5-1]RPE39195.1 DNA-binding PucR family transcriptional regulator [Streptomyces sp. Ag109_O5-1]